MAIWKTETNDWYADINNEKQRSLRDAYSVATDTELDFQEKDISEDILEEIDRLISILDPEKTYIVRVFTNVTSTTLTISIGLTAKMNLKE